MNRSTKPALWLLPVLGLTACASAPATRPQTPTAAAAAPAPLASVPAHIERSAMPRFRAALQLMNSQPQDAQKAFAALAREYPMLSGPLTDLGILQARNRQPKAALASFKRAIEANPLNAVALNWCGTLYKEAGDFTQAEQFYLKALTAKPDYAAATLNLGILYEVALARPAEALNQYRRYQQLAGRNDLVIAAWIKELETGQGTSLVATTGAMP